MYDESGNLDKTSREYFRAAFINVLFQSVSCGLFFGLDGLKLAATVQYMLMPGQHMSIVMEKGIFHLYAALI